MPGTSEYTCTYCGYAEDVMPKNFRLGPWPSYQGDAKGYKAWEQENLRWLEANTQTLICDPCWVCLIIPLRITLASWGEWKTENLQDRQPYADYPFLVGLVSRIDEYLKNNPESPVDLGVISCPYCAKDLSRKNDFSPTCPRCGGANMKFSGGGIVTLRYGSVWPPIA